MEEVKEQNVKRHPLRMAMDKVRVRDQGNKGSLVVGACYRPPNQEESANEAFFLWI